MALLDLATLKAFLNIGTATHDAELALYVSAATDVVESALGGPVEQRTVVETCNGPVDGGRALPLRTRFPVLVTSVTANGVAVSTTDVYVAPGNVLRRKLGWCFAPSGDPIVVTYTSGIAVPASAPAALTLAAAIIAGHLWGTQRGSAGPSGPGDQYGTVNTVVPGLGFAVPNRALELMAPWAPQTGLVLA
jgi:hypothetical protein